MIDTDVAKILLEIKEDTGKLVSQYDAVSLRVTKLESSQTRQWWVTVAVAPTLALLHAVARKLGAQI